LLVLQGRYAEADARLRLALEEHRQREDPRGIALGLLVLGNIAIWRGDLIRARDLHIEAAARLRDLGNRAELVSLFQAAIASPELGEFEAASDLAARCDLLGRNDNRPVASAAALHLRALIAARRGDQARALRTIQQALALEHRLADQQRLVETFIELGHV